MPEPVITYAARYLEDEEDPDVIELLPSNRIERWLRSRPADLGQRIAAEACQCEWEAAAASGDGGDPEDFNPMIEVFVDGERLGEFVGYIHVGYTYGARVPASAVGDESPREDDHGQPPQA